MRRPGLVGSLVVGTLATWRVSRLIVTEDGPGQVVVRLRKAVDDTPLAGLMDCFACTSVWIGAGVAAVMFGGRLPLRDVAVGALALSGAALLIEEATRRGYLPEQVKDSPLVTVLDEP